MPAIQRPQLDTTGRSDLHRLLPRATQLLRRACGDNDDSDIREFRITGDELLLSLFDRLSSSAMLRTNTEPLRRTICGVRFDLRCVATDDPL